MRSALILTVLAGLGAASPLGPAGNTPERRDGDVGEHVKGNLEQYHHTEVPDWRDGTPTVASLNDKRDGSMDQLTPKQIDALWNIIYALGPVASTFGPLKTTDTPQRRDMKNGTPTPEERRILWEIIHALDPAIPNPLISAVPAKTQKTPERRDDKDNGGAKLTPEQMRGLREIVRSLLPLARDEAAAPTSSAVLPPAGDVKHQRRNSKDGKLTEEGVKRLWDLLRIALGPGANGGNGAGLEATPTPPPQTA